MDQQLEENHKKIYMSMEDEEEEQELEEIDAPEIL